jgi:hypothetical protein
VDLVVVEVVLRDIENVAAHTDRLPTLDKHDDVEEDVVVVVDTLGAVVVARVHRHLASLE